MKWVMTIPKQVIPIFLIVVEVFKQESVLQTINIEKAMDCVEITSSAIH